MRIQPDEQAAIVSTIAGFDKESEIYLFGSRLDDTKRGGDIDVLVKSDVICRSMLAHIEDELSGERYSYGERRGYLLPEAYRPNPVIARQKSKFMYF